MFLSVVQNILEMGSTKIPLCRNVRHMCTCTTHVHTCAFTCAHVQNTCTHVQKMLFSGNREIIFCIFREPGSHFPGISFNFSLAQGYFSTLTHVQHMYNTCATFLQQGVLKQFPTNITAHGQFSTLTHVQHMCNTCAKYCC